MKNKSKGEPFGKRFYFLTIRPGRVRQYDASEAKALWKRINDAYLLKINAGHLMPGSGGAR
jgi:hypothetical protein